MDRVKDDTTKVTVHSIMLGFGTIIALLAWFWIIPSILTSFTITTNIEMMKNKESMHKVISNQRMDRTKRSFRIY